MMEILLDITASFSAMERRLSKLISDVSDIKQKQDNLHFSLYCLQPRKSDGECRRPRGFLPSPKRPFWQRRRKSTSPTSSTPVKRKPTVPCYVCSRFICRTILSTYPESFSCTIFFRAGLPKQFACTNFFQLGLPQPFARCAPSTTEKNTT